MNVIRMDTARGVPIDNLQSDELTRFESSQFPNLVVNYPLAEIRSNPNPRYNCHGLTFGSRRSAVGDHSIAMILEHDGYQELPIAQARPGDVILYFGEQGDVHHSGIVVSNPVGFFGIPYVVSKWGKGGEFLHSANNSPYGYQVKCYRISK
jgi:uncharacterized protein YfaT (DUF1175 family)